MRRPTIPIWLSKVLRHYGATGIECLYFSDQHLTDCEAKQIKFLFDEAETAQDAQMMTSDELKAHLEGLKVRMNADYAPSFWTVLTERLADTADKQFDYNNLNGGSLQLRFVLNDAGSEIELCEFTPTEPDETGLSEMTPLCENM